MKGFNIAPAPSSTTQLPTVAEFMANLQQQHEHHVATHHLQDIFGSTTSAIFGSSLGSSSTPKKSHHHPNNNSSSGGGGNGDHHTHRGGFGRLPRLHIKRSSSHKRRWGTLIEAAKSGRVSRLIGRSRSEDSVCNSHCRNEHNLHCSNHSHSNSPASDDITESPSDSNPSLADAPTQTVAHSGIGMAALAALRKRRKKFSASRNMNMADSGGHPIAPQSCCVIKGGKKQLQRASSVPTRASEVVTLMSHRHEQTQSQQHSVELGNNETLTPSTTEESVTAYSTGVGGGVSVGSNSREPLLATGSMNPANHNTTSQSSTQQQQQGSQNKSHNGSVVVLPNLPGIQPVSGHNMSAGWL